MSRQFARVTAQWPWAMAAAAFGAGALTMVVARQFAPSVKTVRQPIDADYACGDEQFSRTLGNLLSPPIRPGNRITTLLNGDEIFPAMLSAISRARETITFETFIYWAGDIGRAFADAIIAKARDGVKCHVLLDWIGSKRMDLDLLQAMDDAGVEIVRYHHRWWHLTQVNHRTHRKLLVIDGKIGFIGGVGIADQWLGRAEDEKHWRDNHYQVEGPVVAQLQAAFTDNWLKRLHVVLHDGRYFPALTDAGTHRAQVFQSSPDEGSESMRLLYLLGIGAARRSIRIATAYFVPDQLAIQTLARASERGVNVEIIVPGPHIDVRIVRHASRKRWGDLLRAGVKIYEYRPTMYHCKAMIIDDCWTSIGSANFDNRSFRLNDEANLNVYDAAFAQEQIRWFEEDKERCRPVSLRKWEKRDVADQVLDATADVVGSQL